MNNYFKKFFTHFALYILDVGFRYLHKMYDIYYDLEREEFFVDSKKEGIDNEKSCI